MRLLRVLRLEHDPSCKLVSYTQVQNKFHLEKLLAEALMVATQVNLHPQSACKSSPNTQVASLTLSFVKPPFDVFVPKPSA